MEKKTYKLIILKKKFKKMSISGYITKIIENDNFHIIIELNKEKIYRYNGFLRVIEGDMIYSKCDDNNILYQPFIYIPDDEDSVKQYINIALKNFRSIDTLYDEYRSCAYNLGYCSSDIKNQYDVPGKSVINYINVYAIKYYNTKNNDILETFTLNTCLNEKQTMYFLKTWYSKRILRKLYLLGMNNKEINDMKMDADIIYDKLIENPYPIYTISINTAKNIMDVLNKPQNDDDIECGKIIRVIYQKMVSQKCTCIYESFCDDVYRYKEKLENEYDVVFDNNYLYLKYSYIVETHLYEYFNKLIKRNVPFDISIDNNNYICKTLTDEQKNTILSTLSNYISIVDSSAGTGKSTIIREIIHNLEIRKIKYCVTSFTGKAVYRINQISGKDVAKTLDTYILSPMNDFKYLIIDEVSMVTTELFYRFISVHKHNFRIILIGDSMQLSPVSWDCLMSHLISSERIPIYKLSINHRSTSLILKNANMLIEKNRINDISNGKIVPSVVFENGDGFHYFNNDISFISNLVSQMYDSGISVNRFVILSPYNDVLVKLNEIVKNIYMKNAKSCEYKNIKYSVGDRVMMLHNNNWLKIYNGNEGIITNIYYPGDEKMIFGGLNIDFSGKQVKIDFVLEDAENNVTISQIQHSFAITIDKSQGSEYDFVIIFIDRLVADFININRLYVAITRTMKECFLIGNSYAIMNSTCTLEKTKQGFLSTRLQNEGKLNVNSYDDFDCCDDWY